MFTALIEYHVLFDSIKFMIRLCYYYFRDHILLAGVVHGIHNTIVLPVHKISHIYNSTFQPLLQETSVKTAYTSIYLLLM